MERPRSVEEASATPAAPRKGDVAKCAHCGYVYTLTARARNGCRRCGADALERWRPQADEDPGPPDGSAFL